MATSNINKQDDDNEQWQTAQDLHNQHQWDNSSDDDGVDNHEFFDAHDTDFNHNQPSPTQVNAEAELLHNRLNTQLSTNEEVTKKKTPG
jgi:hypothetical protein